MEFQASFFKSQTELQRVMIGMTLAIAIGTVIAGTYYLMLIYGIYHQNKVFPKLYFFCSMIAFSLGIILPIILILMKKNKKEQGK